MGSSRAFILHAVGAALTVAVVLLLAARLLFSPVDLFVSSHLAICCFLQFAAATAIFYGFSLVLIRACPLPNRWAMAYAVASWLLFLWTFFPTPQSGMMRRIADAESYYAMQRLIHRLGYLAVIGFVLVQAAFLRYVFLRLRSLPPDRVG